MKKIAYLFLLASVCIGAAYGEEKKTASAATSDAIQKLEHDWADAVKAGDADKLGPILADDFVVLGPDGSLQTKKELLADVKSGTEKIESYEFGPMHVKVLGNVAIVQGGDTEKSSYQGKDTSGKWAWMDVFVKRGDKWQVVRSQTTMLK
ncbi:MAG TPA: nuclear transport factor 2 family protein [Bryobacteraceae bacterium]|nr:nuclear transport factor 2 family protein [Bryobacteraceae bacterium]